MTVAPLGYGEANESRVRVRSAPNLDGEELGHLYERDLLEIYEKTPEEETIGEVKAPWLRIKTLAGLEGWVFGAFVTELSEAEYKQDATLRTVATINPPWELGSVSESMLAEGTWGGELPTDTWRVDFAPGTLANTVSVAGGDSVVIETEAGKVLFAGAFRVRNGYLVTELVEIDMADWPTLGDAFPRGFAIWDVAETEDSLYSLYREDTLRIYDVNALVPAGAERRVGNRVVKATGAHRVELSKDLHVMSSPGEDGQALEFGLREGETIRARTVLPAGRDVFVLATFGDDWLYLDTMLHEGETGDRNGWAKSSDLAGS